MRKGAVYADVAEGGENINYLNPTRPPPFRSNQLLRGFGHVWDGVIHGSCVVWWARLGYLL